MAKWTGTVAWANSAPISTAVVAAVPAGLAGYGFNAIHVFNPGAVAITLKLRAKWKDSTGVVRTSDFPDFVLNAVAGAGTTKTVQGIGVLDEFEILATNDVAVGAAGAFTAQLAIEFS